MNSIEIYEVNENGEDKVKIKIHDAAGLLICTDTIPGNLLPETCEKCGTAIVYSINEDTKLCAMCNEWLEAKCTDPDCETCNERLEHPLTMGTFI